MSTTTPFEAFTQAELYVFDLDGTLVDSKKDIGVSINYAMAQLGLPLKSEDDIAELLYQGSKGVISDLLDVHANHFEKVFAIYTQHYESNLLVHTQYYSGVKELLSRLQHKKLAILSNKRTRFCEAIIEGLDPDHRFLDIVGGDAFSEKKPDPVGLQYLCKKHGVDPQRTWMIGDSPVDIEAGQRTGTHTLAILEGFTSAPIMAQTPATLKVSHLKEMLSLF